VEGECLPVTNASGFRVYCKQYDHHQQNNQQNHHHHHQQQQQPAGTTGSAAIAACKAGVVRGSNAPPAGFSLLAKPMRQMMQVICV